MIDPMRRLRKREGPIRLAESATSHQVGEELTGDYFIAGSETIDTVQFNPFPTTEDQLRVLALERDNAEVKRELLNVKRELEIVRRSAVDLSPIILYEVESEDYTLLIREELRFIVALSDDRSLFVGANEEFTVRLSAYSRAELTDKLKQEILFLWEEYSKAEDGKLSPDALRLKSRLLSAIQERDNAAED